MRLVLEFVTTFAAAEEPILILGERGTGKTSLAYHIHCVSGRRGDFVSHVLGGGNEDLHQSTLFGHVQGAFTGATTTRIGLFETARYGTLLLDEITTASPGLQVMLLQLFDQKSFRRLGGDRLLPFLARVITVTNDDIKLLAHQRRFRPDLYDRLRGLTITLPPLRHRRDEIVPLFEHLFNQKAREQKKPPFAGITPEAEAALLGYDWPGNLRELDQVARQAATLTPPDQPVTAGVLSSELDGQGQLPGLSLEERIATALRVCKNNRAAAARYLGKSRSHFYRLLKKTQLSLNPSHETSPGSGGSVS
jgi:DNA-binding NtrC family response regulator